MSVFYTKKHIRIEKHVYLPDLVAMDSLHLPNWNLYLPKESLVNNFRHPLYVCMCVCMYVCMYIIYITL